MSRILTDLLKVLLMVFEKNFLSREGEKISKLKSVEALFIANHRIYCEFAGQFLKGGDNYLNGGIHFAT